MAAAQLAAVGIEDEGIEMIEQNLGLPAMPTEFANPDQPAYRKINAI
jgi:hypothetical protein